MVDLICERPIAAAGEAERFVPHLGGVMANVAVFAARAGAPVAITGAVGHDRWGRWLTERLATEGVIVDGLRLQDEALTQLAFVSVDADGEPTYLLYGEPADPLLGFSERDLEAAVAGAAGLLIGTNTLSGPSESRLTMRARACALALGLPIIFDCNLRLHRWPSSHDAAVAARACVPGAALVRANLAEATLMTGEADPDRAAEALLGAGAAQVVITLGADGALLCGGDGAGGVGPRLALRAPEVTVLSTVGAGDALTGTLLAALHRAGHGAETMAEALPEALAAASAACERWGAID